MDLGLPASLVRESLGSFPGIEHRLEFFRETEGIRFYNDSAATIPEAAAAAIETFTGSSGQTEPYLILVTGGTDKNLDFNPLVKAIVSAGSTLEIVLLSGTGSEKLIAALQREGISFRGPFDNIDKAARTALELGLKAGQRTNRPTDTQITVVLSPGCTSFGMFNNEFDRGLQWKEAVHRL
jgi:UDP-N-acetylmuramoylalanine--D-glutamate ligase